MCGQISCYSLRRSGGYQIPFAMLSVCTAAAALANRQVWITLWLWNSNALAALVWNWPCWQSPDGAGSCDDIITWHPPPENVTYINSEIWLEKKPQFSNERITVWSVVFWRDARPNATEAGEIKRDESVDHIPKMHFIYLLWSRRSTAILHLSISWKTIGYIQGSHQEAPKVIWQRLKNTRNLTTLLFEQKHGAIAASLFPVYRWAAALQIYSILYIESLRTSQWFRQSLLITA